MQVWHTYHEQGDQECIPSRRRVQEGCKGALDPALDALKVLVVKRQRVPHQWEAQLADYKPAGVSGKAKWRALQEVRMRRDMSLPGEDSCNHTASPQSSWQAGTVICTSYQNNIYAAGAVCSLVEVPVDGGGVPVVGGLVGQQEAPHLVRIRPVHIHLQSAWSNRIQWSTFRGPHSRGQHILIYCTMMLHNPGYERIATLENSGKVVLYVLRTAALMSALLPGSSPPNWLHGNASICAGADA